MFDAISLRRIIEFDRQSGIDAIHQGTNLFEIECKGLEIILSSALSHTVFMTPAFFPSEVQAMSDQWTLWA